MYSAPLIEAWLGMQITGGHIGAPILLATLHFSSLKRLVTLYNLLWTWVFNTFIACMLLYSGHAFPDDPEPHYVLCIMQAAMIYSVPMLNALSALILIYDGWTVIRGRVDPPKPAVAFRRNVILVLVPWIAWMLNFLASLLVGVFSSSDLGRNRRSFYCAYKNDYFTDILAILVAMTTGTAVLFTIKVTCKLYMSWAIMKSRMEDTQKSDESIESAVRIAIFGFYLMLALALSLVSVVAPKSPIPDLFVASVPVAIFVVFGTQRDILAIWASIPRKLFSCLTMKRRPIIGAPQPISHAASESYYHEKPQRQSNVANSYTVWREKFFSSPPIPATSFPVTAPTEK